MLISIICDYAKKEPNEELNNEIEKTAREKGWKCLTDTYMMAYTGKDTDVKERINRVLMYQFNNENRLWRLLKDRLTIVLSLTALIISIASIILR